MPTPRLETYTLTDSAPAAATIEAVMDQLRMPENRKQWQSEIVWMKGPEGLTVGDSVEGLADMMGFRVEGRATTTDLGPNHYEEDVVVGVRMRMRFEIVPAEDGVVVKHILEAPLPGGLAGKILSVFLKRRLRRMQAESLRNLCRYAGSDASV
jgi:hypothetical protein